MLIRKRVVIVAASLGFAGLLGGGVAAASSSSPSPTARPTYVPNHLRTPVQMPLIGSNGKPIIGKSGKPIMITVGGQVPIPPAPPAQYLPSPSNTGALAQSQAHGAKVTIPNETNLQKARRLAPSQAP